ncbi:MAG: hypothetical protein OES47_08305 [Acidobacteriota bacterium]|nr:hypothetical protein [Acidobacteriota bacterium]
MKRPPRAQLLQVEADAAVFSPLIAAAREAGVRVGWLTYDVEIPPDRLETAATSGVLRAVSVGGGRAISVKPLVGAPVLGDLLREHFAGCRLVLVSGETGELELQSLEPASDGGWRVGGPGGRERVFSTQDLVRRLRGRHLLRQVPLK